MVTYADYAKDLRALALTFELLEPDLPMPRYAEQGLNITIQTFEAADVIQAAKALNTDVDIHNGHTTTTTDFGTVTFEFVHVSDDSMAEHYVRLEYLKTMPKINRDES
jgi:hypothetical protein